MAARARRRRWTPTIRPPSARSPPRATARGRRARRRRRSTHGGGRAREVGVGDGEEEPERAEVPGVDQGGGEADVALVLHRVRHREQRDGGYERRHHRADERGGEVCAAADAASAPPSLERRAVPKRQERADVADLLELELRLEQDAEGDQGEGFVRDREEEANVATGAGRSRPATRSATAANMASRHGERSWFLTFARPSRRENASPATARA